MNNATLAPMTIEQANQLVNASNGEVTSIKYLPGHPRQYRFDASRGFFNVNGMIPISQKDESITILPVAYRIFTDDILGIGDKEWVEFFFLNKSNHLCTLLLHGYSVEGLIAATNELFYDDVNLCQVALMIQPIEKTSKQQDENGKYPKYYIAKFSYKPLEEKTTEQLKASVEGKPIWRADTLTNQVMTQVSVNYQPPVVKEEIGATKEASTENPETQADTVEVDKTPRKKTPSKARRAKNSVAVVA